MTHFKIALALVSVLGLSSVAASPSSPAAPAAPTAPTPDLVDTPTTPAATPTFLGCWTPTPAGTCRGIFLDGSTYKRCGACGPTGEPPKYNGSCTTISAGTLASGYWCS